MSKRIPAEIECRKCGNKFNVNLYRSIWIEEPENRELIFENEINAVTCPECNDKTRLKFPFLCTNVKKKIAVWYEPYHDPEIDKDIAQYASTMGADSFYAKAPRISNWEEFKKTIIEIERQRDAHQVQNRKPRNDSLDNKYIDTSREEVIGMLEKAGFDMDTISEEEFERLWKIADLEKKSKKVRQTRKLPNPNSNPHLKKSEDTIMELINSGLGEKYSLAYKIDDIDELPFNSFKTLQRQLSSGKAIIRMSPGSIDGTTFNIISTPTENRLATLYTFITYLGPIIGIILSFVHSWYWLSLIVIAPIVGMSLNKKTYLHALFNRSFNSEIIFSYLFTAGKVTIELPDHGILYRNPEKRVHHWKPSPIIEQLDREKEENKKRDREKKKAEKKEAKLQEDFSKQERYYINALESQKNSAGFKTINKVEDIDYEEPHLIDTSFAMKKWDSLEKITDKLLDEEEDRNDVTPFNINEIFDSCIGISNIEPGDFMLSHQEGTNGDSVKIYIENTVGKQNYLNVIKVDNSLDALIEGFYIALSLPCKAGLMEDIGQACCRFILNNDSLIRCLKERCGFGTIPTDGTEINKIDCPSGIRVKKTKDGFRVSCLAYSLYGEISDLSILIREGQIEICPYKSMLDMSVNKSRLDQHLS